MENNENELIEQYKAQELELKQQLEEAQAKYERLELEMQYKDKVTGLWNRKYIDKIVTDNIINCNDNNFTIIYTGVNNLKALNDKDGDNAGDNILRSIGENMQNIFGSDAICCKIAGTKMCAFLITPAEELEQKVASYNDFISESNKNVSIIDISFGVIRYEEHIGKDLQTLLQEAEYNMLIHHASKDNAKTTAKTYSGKPTILLIDDSMIMLKTLQMMLDDRYKVLKTTTGMQGFEIAKDKQPDLILLDYNMPIVDGERIMHLLKQGNTTKDIPVIFVSGVSDKAKILKVAQYKPAGYLLKPVSKDNLLNVVENALYN